MLARFYRVKALSGVWEREEETDISVIILLLGTHPFPHRQSTHDMYDEYISPILASKLYRRQNNAHRHPGSRENVHDSMWIKLV